MVRIRHGWLVAALALGFSAGACKKDEKKADPSAAKAGEKPMTPGEAAKAVTGGANATADDLSLLPVDSEIVMGLNFSQLQKSALWQKFVGPQMMKGDTQQKLTEFKAKCGFDPMGAVTSISIGMKGIGAETPDGVVVVHGPQKAQVLSCIDKMKDDITKDGTTYTNEGGVLIFKPKTGDAAAFTYVNDTTLVGVVGPNATVAGVTAAAKGGSALKTSAAFVEMYGKINTADSLWLLMNGSSKAFDKAAALGFKPKAVFGSVNVSDGLAVDMRMRLDSAEQASQIVSMAKAQTAAFSKMVDKLDISNEAADVKVVVAMSSQKLEQLVSNFAGMMGAMGGMGQ